MTSVLDARARNNRWRAAHHSAQIRIAPKPKCRFAILDLKSNFGRLTADLVGSDVLLAVLRDGSLVAEELNVHITLLRGDTEHSWIKGFNCYATVDGQHVGFFGTLSAAGSGTLVQR